MPLRETERQTTLRFFLIGLTAFTLIPFTIELFHYNKILLTIKIILLIFFLTLYFINEKTHKTELITHILLLGGYTILCIGFYLVKNSDIASIWLLFLPLLSFILLSPKQSLLYSFLALSTIGVLFIIYPESASFMEKFRIFAFGIFLTGSLYILSRSRSKAWEKTEDYMHNLEDKVEEALAQKVEQQKLLIHTSKLATLGELMSSIAHQWKQPIATISAISMNFRLKEELSESSDISKLKLCDELEEQTEFMSRTMDDFRSFFKAKEQESAFILNMASQELIRLFEKNFKAQNITINNCESDNIEVFGYSNMFKQVLLNIISNAKDAINENKPDNTDINITYAKDDIFGIVTVEDYAGGIREEVLNKVFEKHFSTKGENGSGIGLAMAKEIIEDFCHGKLSVENTDKGARFSIYIPLRKS
jgi:signal transduction histidine kinase